MKRKQTNELRVLLLEDVPTDAELVTREIGKLGLPFSTERVETREQFTRSLEQCAPDIILADYNLPQFDGLTALAIAREKCPEVPFVFVSGTLGEERAVETLQLGASDYVLKDHLSRLVPAVRHALEATRSRKEERAAQEKLREQLEELRRFERVAIGREQRMQELKEENARLLARLAELERPGSNKGA